MLVTIAIIVWLIINYFTWWLLFSSLLCVFAGIFMIMPSLLDFDFRDFLHITKYKKILWINVLANFIITPLIAFGVWTLVFRDIGLTISLVLLSLLSWGGLVFSRIQKTKWNTSLWFQLFMFNLLVFSGIFFLVTPWVQNIWVSQMPVLNCNISGPITCGKIWWWVSPISAIVVLVLFPLLLSRVIRMSEKIKSFAKKYSKFLSQIGTFVIIWYIFSLQQIHTIFNTEIYLLFKIFLGTLLFYIILFAYNIVLHRRALAKNPESLSLFWILTSRFITLWLVLSFMYTQYFWASIMLVFVSAYFIQIWLSQLISRYIKQP